ncbi:hypothetical protein PHLCEN_2v9921 [Hermanssonia centrifuga]|uniref:F-box domain-containing protein n=1 Tax=Hermanssonia centrifuga TaxID=98765 RepID=A0A2R6NPD1_9APHY|nr:hypothetical protein PHLCEN_2v9921 [Hermanssonia centrifuga]
MPTTRLRTRPTKSASASLASKATRKALHAVDTNTASYDRTDPFTALNVLRKLIASLPARLGGCQFKLSPEEHRLSMHLLTIVEPFVGASHSRRTLTRQPTELLDAIVFHLDSKSDLLSLALSCKRMHGVIFPRHYHYRTIRAKVSSLSVWNHLVVHRSLARNVRVLEILDERTTEPELLPPDILTTDTDLESSDDELSMHVKQERFLVSALARMTALESFTWSCNHSPICIDCVWPSLLKCQSLNHVDINDNLIFTDIDTVEKTPAKRQTLLPEVRTVALKSTKHVYGSTKTPTLARVSAMLHNCPNLEDLSIGYGQRRGGDFMSPIVDDLFMFGRWPQLRLLSLTQLWCTPHAGPDITATFLSAHVNLQVLHLDMSTTLGAAGAQISLPPDSLPHLRELKSSRDFASAVLQCPCSVEGGRPLEIIKGVKLSGSGWDDKFFRSLAQFGSNVVKRIELAGWSDVEDLRRLIECIPKLVWLDIGTRTNNSNSMAYCSDVIQANTNRNASSLQTSVLEWATLLASLTGLAAFHGVRFFYEVTSTNPAGPITISERSKLRKNEEIASILAWKCPKLRRLDHWEDGSGKVVVLLRDGDQVKYEVRRMKV